MSIRAGLLLLAAALTLPAQMRLSIQQLESFIKSSVDLKHEDRKVAAYLKGIRLTERLDERTIEELQGYGIGPNTTAGLRALREASTGLPLPKPAEPKPAPTPIAPPSAAEQREIIEKVRDHALNYSKRLPDFICTQVTRRFIDPAGLEFWRQMDVITTRLSFFEQKEDYKVILVNNQSTDVPFEKLGGTTTRNEFGTQLKKLFEPSTQAEFHWERWATLRGRRVHVYNYRVEQPRSEFSIAYMDQTPIIAGYHGLVYVDRDSNTVMRMRLEADVPPSYPLQQIVTDLDYDYVDISGQEFLLPLKHVARSRDGRMLSKNEVEFRMYRKFGAETTITFDTPAPLPDSQTTERPPVP